MWNRRENPLRPAGKGDKRSPQTCPMFLLGFPAAGGHHRASPPCHAWLVPNSGHVPSGNGKGGGQEAALPAPTRPPKAWKAMLPPDSGLPGTAGSGRDSGPAPSLLSGQGGFWRHGCPGCMAIAQPWGLVSRDSQRHSRSAFPPRPAAGATLRFNYRARSQLLQTVEAQVFQTDKGKRL